MTSAELRERIMRAIFDADCTIWNDHTEAFEDDDHIHLGAEADAVLAVLQASRDEQRAEFLNLKVSLVNAARRGDMDRVSEIEEKLNDCFDAAFGGAEEVTG